MPFPEPSRQPQSREAVEQEWFDRIRGGDERAFEALFRAYGGPLCEFALGYVKSSGAAQDLVQDLFVHLWENRETLGTPRSVQAYLYGAVRNRALNQMRRSRIELAFVMRTLRSGVAHDAATRTITPEDDLHAREFADAVARAVEKLPPRCREAFTLTRDYHLSYAEAAQVLGITPKTVHIHIGRALALLREHLRTWLT